MPPIAAGEKPNLGSCSSSGAEREFEGSGGGEPTSHESDHGNVNECFGGLG
jgi:hypothetical protein